MAFPEGYAELLELLAAVFRRYREATGIEPLLVGGAAAAIMTAGAFMSGDFDVIAEDDEAFSSAMLDEGFVVDQRVGRLLGGFYHPVFPEYGVEQVSGLPFDGRADRGRYVRLRCRTGDHLTLPSYEDLIADRLGQYAVASASDQRMLNQARAILALAESVDLDYLRRRVAEDGGDVTLLNPNSGGRAKR